MEEVVTLTFKGRSGKLKKVSFFFFWGGGGYEKKGSLICTIKVYYILYIPYILIYPTLFSLHYYISFLYTS